MREGVRACLVRCRVHAPERRELLVAYLPRAMSQYEESDVQLPSPPLPSLPAHGGRTHDGQQVRAQVVAEHARTRTRLLLSAKRILSGGRCALGGMMFMAGDTQGEDAHVTILMCTTPTRERCAAVPRYRVLSPVRCHRATQMIQLRADGESTFLRAARSGALAHLPSCVRVPVGSGASHGFSPGGGQASGIGPLDPGSGPCLCGSPPNASACSGGFLRPFAA